MGNTGSVVPKPGQKYSVINVAFPGNTVDVFNTEGRAKSDIGVKLGTCNYVATAPQHHYLADAYRGETSFTWRSEAGPNVVYEEDAQHDSCIRNGVPNTTFDLANQRWYLMYKPETNSYQILNAGSGKAVTYMGNLSETGVRCCAPDPNNLTQQWKINEI